MTEAAMQNVHLVKDVQMTLSVTIRGKHERALRNWLGARLLKLAAAVMACQMSVTVTND